MKNKQGFFVLSLDFETMWGSIGSKDIQSFALRTAKEKEIFYKVNELFNEYGIHSTWAIVGAMACKTKEETISHLKNDIYYKKWNISIKDFIENAPTDYFLSNLINKLSLEKNVEIASHTFTHSYFLDDSLSCDDLENELSVSKRILSSYGEIKTIIFPRNQINPNVFPLMEKYDYSIMRANQKRLFKNNRYLEYFNSIFPITNKTSYSPNKLFVDEYNILNIPASLFLRFRKKNDFIHKLQIRRVKKEMRKSAKRGLVFHLWFHPHNLGLDVDNGINGLRQIFDFYSKMNEKHSYKSVNMRELKQIIIDKGV